MTNDRIIAALQKWQQDGMTKSRGVFVSYYSLQPQSSGFMLELELHVDGETDYEQGQKPTYVFGGTLSETFNKAADLIERKKAKLRKAPDE